MALSEKLIELVVDKVLIGGIVLIAGYWLNKRFEIFKSDINEKYRQRQILVDLENQQKQRVAELEQEIVLARHQAELEFLERQISEFYWPIYLRLEKDNAMWQRIATLGARDHALPDSAGEIIERDFILKNHDEIVAIIESKIHLAEQVENSQELIEELLKYLKHVAIYKAVRSIESMRGVNPMDLNEPFPSKLFPLIQHNFRSLQARYEQLKQAKFRDLNPS